MLIKILLLCLLLNLPRANAANVTLAWDANPEPDIAYYLLSYGPASGSYPFNVNVGKMLLYVVTNIAAPPATWYFAVAAVNEAGAVGDLSQEISYTIPTGPGPFPTNMPPAISNITNTATIAGQLARVVVYVWDIETAPEALVLSATSSHQGLIPNTGLTFSVGTNTWERVLTIRPNPGVAGIVQISVSVSDGRDIVATSFMCSVVSAPRQPQMLTYKTDLESSPTRTGPWSPVWGTVTLNPTNYYRVRP